MSKETFKIFVKNHPELLTRVRNQEMTWQGFYEMYDMYGENNEIWNQYLDTSKGNTSSRTISNENKDMSVQELVNMVKKIDLDTVRKGINSLQKAIGLVQDLGIGTNKKGNNTETYQPRPMYKYFED